MTVASTVATYLNNKKRRQIARLEDEGGVVVQVLGKEGISPEHLVILCVDADGREVRVPFA